MKRSSTKKGIERRKRPRPDRSKARSVARKEPKPVPTESCAHCSKSLAGSERALFVEEEVGRIFCSEDCIAGYFAPDIERLEKEYFRRLSSSDLSAPERESYAHLRWITLQEPDEVWREKTLTGDYRYTLISEFQPGNKKIWCVCICLFLRGEPSFLFLAFPTRNAAMAAHYRRGEQVEIIKPAEASSLPRLRAGEEPAEQVSEGQMSDRLAEPWTEGETYLAQLGQERRPDDIPQAEFELYHGCLEETLKEPDEVWSFQLGDEESPRFFHFIRHYPEETPGVWYVIAARETDEEEQIEIVDAFPTRDMTLVDRFRRGTKEIGEESVTLPASRVVH